MRIEQLAATFVAKTVTSSINNPARRRLLVTLPQDYRLFTEKNWLPSMVRATQLTLHDVDLVGRGEDRRIEGYMDPPPWTTVAAATIHITTLPCKKTQCLRKVLLARAKDTFLQTDTAGARVYYTDGSVDPNTGKTAAAFVWRGETWLEDV
ncbi:hypothetical protein E2C01_074924 [Portunus trituberculatus]|uniref:Uncharacterized protein n=1 Tax=Portunus trituberculatus TaxID=210409 RepID=A0A5B7IEF7_PORTR|nr:hypothetical protein [Portunus trituberculatus]